MGKHDRPLHKPLAWTLAILVLLALGLVAAAPRTRSGEPFGPGRDVPPRDCADRCEHFVPHFDFGIERYGTRL